MSKNITEEHVEGKISLLLAFGVDVSLISAALLWPMKLHEIPLSKHLTKCCHSQFRVTISSCNIDHPQEFTTCSF